MKKFVLLFVAVIFFMQCGKDKNCPEGYEGNNCDREKEPTRILLDEIEISLWPEVRGNGQTWDAGSGISSNPDIYYEISDSYGVIAYSTVHNNPVVGSDFLKDNVFASIKSGVQYTFNIYDHDDNGDELIGTAEVPKWLDGQDFPALQIYTGNGFVITYTVRYEF